MTKTSTSFDAVTPFRIRHRRQALELTQEQLAARVGVSPNTVARWERGERKARIPGAVDALLTQLEEEKRQKAAATSSAPTPEAPVNQAPAAQQEQPTTTVQEQVVAKKKVGSSRSRVARPAAKDRSKPGPRPKAAKKAAGKPRGGGRATAGARRRRS